MSSIGYDGTPWFSCAIAYPNARVETASTSFTATKMKGKWYVMASQGTAHAAIYTGSSPHSLIEYCNGVNTTAHNAIEEIVLTLRSGVSIVNGTSYWICSAGSATAYPQAANSAGTLIECTESFPSWPSTISQYTTYSRQLIVSAYDEVVAPVANFTGTPVKFTYPNKVTFTDTSTNTPTSWDWDFGDGSTHSTTQNPTHIYTKTGKFTVVLIATNSAGSDTKTATAFITTSASMILGLNY